MEKELHLSAASAPQVGLLAQKQQQPLDKVKGPAWTAGATTVTLSTAMALP